jgi:hypothetical protein
MTYGLGFAPEYDSNRINGEPVCEEGLWRCDPATTYMQFTDLRKARYGSHPVRRHPGRERSPMESGLQNKTPLKGGGWRDFDGVCPMIHPSLAVVSRRHGGCRRTRQSHYAAYQ